MRQKQTPENTREIQRKLIIRMLIYGLRGLNPDEKYSGRSFAVRPENYVRLEPLGQTNRDESTKSVCIYGIESGGSK